VKKIITIFFTASLLLTGCLLVISTESHLRVISGEKWTFNMVIKAPQDQVLMYSGDLSTQFDELNKESLEKGVDFRWELGEVDSQGNIDIIIDVNGTGFEKWNEWIGYSDSLQMDELLGEPVISFQLSMLDTAIGQGLTNNFSLTGGKILSTNGKTINSSTVNWVDIDQMEAVMEYPRSNRTLWVIVLIAGIALFLLAIILSQVSQKRVMHVQLDKTRVHNQAGQATPSPFVQNNQGSSSPEMIQVITKQTGSIIEENHIQFCGNCGSAWKTGANFCAICGWAKNDGA